MKICVLGTGYVGLVSGAGFAETGNHVVCADIDPSTIEQLHRGELHIFEPGLKELVARNVAAKRLVFTSDIAAAVHNAEVVFIAVGTPTRDGGGADLSAVDAASQSVVDHATRELVLVLKSTVPVGTNERIQRLVAESEHPIHVASNPEFLKEGDAVHDFLHPDRIVIGCDPNDVFLRERLQRIYHPVSLSNDRIFWMDPASAELTKYAANTMLAMRVSFMNEVARLCEAVGANIHHVRHGIGSDERIGSKFLYAGPGYGGSCFPKDVCALIHTGQAYGIELELARATHRTNELQKRYLFRKIRQRLGPDLRGKTIGLWGLAFKPRTDDIRESPALALVDDLLAEGATVLAHDPKAMPQTRSRLGDAITLVAHAYKAAEGVDALVLTTEWREYQNPDFEQLKERMAQPLLFDGRNIWTEYKLDQRGFEYHGIGTGDAPPTPTTAPTSPSTESASA